MSAYRDDLTSALDRCVALEREVERLKTEVRDHKLARGLCLYHAAQPDHSRVSSAKALLMFAFAAIFGFAVALALP